MRLLHQLLKSVVGFDPFSTSSCQPVPKISQACRTRKNHCILLPCSIHITDSDRVQMDKPDHGRSIWTTLEMAPCPAVGMQGNTVPPPEWMFPCIFHFAVYASSSDGVWMDRSRSGRPIRTPSEPATYMVAREMKKNRSVAGGGCFPSFSLTAAHAASSGVWMDGL